MEAPAPINDQEQIYSESLLLNFNLKFKDDTIEFNLYDINNSKLKVIAYRQKFKESEPIPTNYEIEISLDELQKKNKYFKMFDNYQEFKTNFIDLCKDNKINIINFDDNTITISITLMVIPDNIMNLTLKNWKIAQKEQIDYLIKDSKIKDKKIEELNNKVLSLEKIVENLLNKIDKLENHHVNKKKSIDNNISEKTNQITETGDQLNFFGSEIFTNEKEVSFLCKAISKNDYDKINLELLFSSKTDGENEEKLKSAYANKNNILFLIKTKENKRFGGYAHESFELGIFNKNDSKAFLFNIDNLKKYKSNNTDCTIWKDNKTINSINFGGGIDLRIYHKFLTEKNYTKPNGDRYFNYNDVVNALNGKKYFEIVILEVFKVNFK